MVCDLAGNNFKKANLRFKTKHESSRICENDLSRNNYRFLFNKVLINSALIDLFLFWVIILSADFKGGRVRKPMFEPEVRG